MTGADPGVDLDALLDAEEQDAGAAGAPGGERDGAPPAGSEQATGGSSGGSSRAAAAGASQQGRSQQRDLHATLHALSQQAPSFADSGEHPESEEELLRLLTQHLGALGGAAGVGSAAAGAGGGGGGGGEGAAAAGAPPEMASLVDTIMQQLLSKEDIGERYPSWLAANRDKLTQDEYQRYEKQHGFIRAICAMYESTPADFAQLMQQCGQPPQEIVDELAPGMQFGPDGLPTFGGGEEGLPPELKDCTIQ
ncbi:hypothetical protein CHLNCDRAFT_54884 [Chlorella variabilis]|uniref:Uncharacterized protein n=1 Tax=Chlorella variabilis TaxID=554065 RepID=E1ZQZ3_CHLVA|nr:hypothetical protein CHLNCDRAFT_54884 [Chlorella variabilis]EFN51810.1 hypothetical protein CHLNCDRAFT_54884 [Chlorella variabilis]|eukprot:XP_005843912.1 hypothetical protein CHLNCDRAFT_54884 [Chlorella variabilis]